MTSQRHSIARVFFRHAAAVAVVLSTTVGWIPTRSVSISLSESQKETSRYLSNVVDVLALEIGNRNYVYYDQLQRAQDYIHKEFEKLGYAVSLQTYAIDHQVFSNVIATKGSPWEGQPLIIGAHYDSCFNPGADDNASGVAGLLGLAKLLADDHNVDHLVFVAFVNEEPPFFQTDKMGSRVFVKDLKQKGQEIQGAVILEMIGYYSNDWFSQKYFPFLGLFFPNKGNFIAMVGNFNSLDMLRRLRRGFRKNSHFPLRTLTAPSFMPGTNFSDHWSFWKERYPAVMVTDTAFLRNPHYHQPTDLPHTLNYDAMTQVVYGLKFAVSEFLNQKDF